MRHLSAIVICGLVWAFTPPVQAQSMHAGKMTSCHEGFVQFRALWQQHAYAVPPEITRIMLAAMAGKTAEVIHGLNLLPASKVKRWRQTALLAAVNGNQPDTVKALIHAGASPVAAGWIPAWTGTFAMQKIRAAADRERRSGHHSVVPPTDIGLFHVRGMPSRWPWFMAVSCDEAKVVTLMLQGGAPANVRDDAGMDALLIAVIMGNTATVRVLLDHGANPCADDRIVKLNDYYEYPAGGTFAGLARSRDMPETITKRLQCP